MKRRGIGALAPELLVAGAAAVLLASARGRWVNTLGDFGIWYSDVQSLSRGARLMRDILCPYGPLSPAILHGGAKIFGFRVSVLAAADFVSGLAALFLLLAVSRLFLRPAERLAAAALLSGLILWMPGPGSLIYPYAPAVPFGMTLALAALLAALGGRDAAEGALARYARISAAGVLAGLAYATKQEMGAAAALGIAAALLLRHTPRRAIGLTGAAGLAALATVAAFYAWFFRGLPFWQAAQRNSLWPFAAIPAAWKHQYSFTTGYGHPLQSLLEVSRAAAEIAAICGAAALIVGFFRATPRSRRVALALALAGGAVYGALSPWARGSIFSAAPLAAVAALGAAFACRRREASGRAPALGALASASLPLLYRVGFRGWLDGPFGSLGYTLAVPLFAWGASRIFLLGLRPRNREAHRALRGAGFAAAAFALGFGLTNLARIGREPEPVQALATPRGTVWMKPGWVALFRRVDREIEARTVSGETIAILPETHGLDFLFDRRNALPVPKIDEACDPAAEAWLLDALESRRPRLIVLFDERSLVFGTSGFGSEYGAAIVAWVESHYRRVAGPTGGLPSFSAFVPL
jgi:hypothetical protein